MRIDGKDNVKERIEIFNTKDSNYITYKYVFENDNSYNDTVPKWKQKDFDDVIYKTQEERLEELSLKKGGR